MNVPVEVPIPEGWEPVAVSVPLAGEWFLWEGKPRQCQVNGASSWRLIIRRKWEWPPWLTAEWIAKDECGDWWAHQCEPSIEHNGWMSELDMSHLAEWAFDIPLPELPWRESKLRNPHR